MDQSSLRNLFEVNNARTQSVEEVVQTFVPLDSFWRLLNGKNHVVLGSRGSGKTAVLRMLAHDHLTQFDEPAARKIIGERSFIGTFVPMRADWIGTLKNKPWLDKEDYESSFQWRLNLSCCVAFIDTAASCVAAYAKRSDQPFVERDLARMLAKSWITDGRTANTLAELRTVLEDIEWSRQLNSLPRLYKSDVTLAPGGTSSAFDLELFSPMQRAIQVLKRVIKFPSDAVWALALDELEFLEPHHHEIINTFLRAKSDLAFKLSTMPYFHHSLRTKTSQPIVAGNDFDYVYLDNDSGIRRTDRSSWVDWAEAVLSKRIAYVEKTPNADFSLRKLLGNDSPLIDEKPSDWTPQSPMMGLLKKYASPPTLVRANRLPLPQFKDQISRKMHGMLLLRAQADQTRGHSLPTLYSGPKLVARCSDANPRQLIRLFNELTLTRPVAAELNMRRTVDAVNQARSIVSFSGDALRNASTEEGVGGELYEFMKQLLNHFQSRFYGHELTTDYYFAVKLSDRVSDDQWDLVRHAVGLGLLFPKVTFAQPDQLPERANAEFNLAYRLAPKYGLLPRKGKAVALGVAVRGATGTHSSQFSLL